MPGEGPVRDLGESRVQAPMGALGLAAQAAVPWGPQEDEEEEWRREVDEKRNKERRKKEYQDKYLESLRTAQGEGAAEGCPSPKLGQCA